MPNDEVRKPMTYESAGVSISRGNQAVEWIKPLAASTRRPEVVADVGGFAGAFRVGDTELLAGADGVGSKLMLAQALGRYDTIGIDLVAMNVNDVLAAGGEPLFFLDYVAVGKLNPERVRDLVAGVAAGCREAGVALLGGETAEMPDLYAGEDFDLSGFAVGRREYRPLGSPTPGDLLLGLESSGFHSNGYQLVRSVVQESGHSYDERFPALGEDTLGAVLLRPTRIYVRPIRALWTVLNVKAMAHITGGGLIENVPRTLGGLGVQLLKDQWNWPAEMQLIQEWGRIQQAEMLRTFNCGIGFTVVVAEADVVRAQAVLEEHGVRSYVIGRIVDHPGVIVG